MSIYLKANELRKVEVKVLLILLILWLLLYLHLLNIQMKMTANQSLLVNVLNVIPDLDKSFYMNACDWLEDEQNAIK